ncbi:MAG TPA: tRNA (N6-threonylcarbamoyladenosine(37)-N6)-methyltransferase TrmO [Gemmatimonadaceae bacterium]|jgi:tRNA-Thr(GGU) m(6)t(6)A37 methyltransferase TsaA
MHTLNPIGRVSSPLTSRADAPKQGDEGAPHAWLVLDAEFADGARDLRVGQEIFVFTWLHQANRSVLRVRPRCNPRARLYGVFSTRSPDRPNPIGLHRVTVLEVDGDARIRVDAMEAIDGTPIVDIKPVLKPGRER